ncbi:hypothetical protein OG21DRAFT_779739 [Imleria badia]|nr:hypothetical protein OG21DRAFT_779739 [Imleria badia]
MDCICEYLCRCGHLGRAWTCSFEVVHGVFPRVSMHRFKRAVHHSRHRQLLCSLRALRLEKAFWGRLTIVYQSSHTSATNWNAAKRRHTRANQPERRVTWRLTLAIALQKMTINKLSNHRTQPSHECVKEPQKRGEGWDRVTKNTRALVRRRYDED